MKKLNTKAGFTLAELLIVVAIIAVLVAIAIPVFTNQLEKSRDATTGANLRSAYAEAVVQYINSDTGAAPTGITCQWLDTDGNLGTDIEADLDFIASTVTLPTSGRHTATLTLSVNSGGDLEITAIN